MTENTLSLLAPLPPPFLSLAEPWRMWPVPGEPGDEARYADPACDDGAWPAVQLPHLHHATAERDALWYRTRFEAAIPPGQRAILRLGGAFYRTHVWLNGADLGAHEGYFQPFGFDVTDRLRPGENVLAVRCRFPVEAGAFKRKTAVAGIFADWDCKPYPSTLYPHLPAPTEWTVPVGLWQPVSLHAAGPVVLTGANLFPDEVAPERAVLRVALRLRNLTGVARETRVSVAVTPHDFAGAPPASQAEGGPRDAWTVALGPQEERECAHTLVIERPRLWQPWTLGEPALYGASLALDDGPAVERVFGVRGVGAAPSATENWRWTLNGRALFLRGSNYVSDFYLDKVTRAGLARDLDLARDAHLNLLRVHAHVAPDEFYALCDERGMLVMCDFPLIWTYAYHLAPEDDAAFQASVLRQVEDMVWLLGSHPSIVLWSLHNEPPWTPDGGFLGKDVHDSATNRALDEAAAQRARALDTTRPALAASGELDQHLYHGWYTGHWADNRDLAPAFPTEFGVQALPSLSSPFWADLPQRTWPVDPDDPAWAHAGYQALFWHSPGVGDPAQYATLAEYVAESQAYQSFYIRYTLDQWRRRKFAPVSGFIHFLFTDGWPAITWSVLDYYRRPKAGYTALAEAARPVRLCHDPEGGFTVERGFHLVVAEGGRLRVGRYLVNDDARLDGQPVTLSWWLERRDVRLHTLRAWLARLTARRETVALPRADERARALPPLDLAPRRAGEYTLRTRVTLGGRALDDNHLEFRVGAERVHHKPPRRVPGLLLRQVYQHGSLRHTADGFTFSVRNPAMPVTAQHISTLAVDGQPLDPARVDLVIGGQTRSASTIGPQAPLEFPSGETVTVVVRETPLAPGAHSIDMTIQFLGLGEVAGTLKDRLV
jgi:beta-mannosidase